MNRQQPVPSKIMQTMTVQYSETAKKCDNCDAMRNGNTHADTATPTRLTVQKYTEAYCGVAPFSRRYWQTGQAFTSTAAVRAVRPWGGQVASLTTSLTPAADVLLLLQIYCC
jgi:hypothetical protein